jgi:hypothetical protein
MKRYNMRRGIVLRSVAVNLRMNMSKITSVFPLALLAAVAAGVFALALGSAPALGLGKHSLSIVNNSNFWIAYLYITPAGNGNWGPSQLGKDEILSPTESKSWNLDWDTCSVDIKAVSFLGYETEVKGLNICPSGTWTLISKDPQSEGGPKSR